MKKEKELEQEHKREILRTRAAALAAPMTGKDREAAFDVIVFRICNEHYGIECGFMREVCEAGALTMIPCTPPWLAGIINLRGRIVAVLDLIKFFNLPDTGTETRKLAVVVGDHEFECGILVHELIGERAVFKDEIQDTEHRAAQDAPPRWLKNITADRLIILDYEKIRGDKSIVIDAEPGEDLM
ncbi:MAG: chemotaxis protein CheW [Lentisphaerota bacterium]